HTKLNDAHEAGTVAQSFSVRSCVREITFARHVFRVVSGHATDFVVPGEWRETVFYADQIRLLEGTTFDSSGFTERWRRSGGGWWADARRRGGGCDLTEHARGA